MKPLQVVSVHVDLSRVLMKADKASVFKRFRFDFPLIDVMPVGTISL
ncbi:MAG: hypothetical protein WCR83_04280 [Candidatus Methanomethylophilaceae archaeon]